VTVRWPQILEPFGSMRLRAAFSRRGALQGTVISRGLRTGVSAASTDADRSPRTGSGGEMMCGRNSARCVVGSAARSDRFAGGTGHVWPSGQRADLTLRTPMISKSVTLWRKQLGPMPATCNSCEDRSARARDTTHQILGRPPFEVFLEKDGIRRPPTTSWSSVPGASKGTYIVFSGQGRPVRRGSWERDPAPPFTRRRPRVVHSDVACARSHRAALYGGRDGSGCWVFGGIIAEGTRFQRTCADILPARPTAPAPLAACCGMGASAALSLDDPKRAAAQFSESSGGDLHRRDDGRHPAKELRVAIQQHRSCGSKMFERHRVDGPRPVFALE